MKKYIWNMKFRYPNTVVSTIQDDAATRNLLVGAHWVETGVGIGAKVQAEVKRGVWVATGMR
jgi:hypothetical protein